MQTISTEQLQQKLDSDMATVLNVLPEENYTEEHIPGSINIPEDNLEDEVPERFEDDEEIIVYCIDEDCNASPRSAETIASLGFENVRDYEPGIEGWKAEDLDVAAANPR